MSWYSFRPYVSVASRRAQAAQHSRALTKKGRKLSPVTIEGRQIARSFWGRAWCEHLESFSDFESRLPRGRSYARNGSVLDLQISPGRITALIMGSSLYEASVAVNPLPAARWESLKARCAGQIDSLVGLLQGHLSDAVMRVITDRSTGLFPSPSEIQKTCSCPDWADLCKHLAAVLYGVGARLDSQPELLFVLRGIDHLDLLEEGIAGGALSPGEDSLGEADLAGVFGIEIAGEAHDSAKPKKARSAGRPKAAKSKKVAPAKRPARKPAKKAPHKKKSRARRQRTSSPVDGKKRRILAKRGR